MATDREPQNAAIEHIRDRLQGLQDRGIFSGFRERRGHGGRSCFDFCWLLGREFTLEYSAAKNTLAITQLLPEVEHRSSMDTDLRRWVASKRAGTLPEASGTEGEDSAAPSPLASVQYQNRKQQVVLSLPTGPKTIALSLTALLGLVNDLFTHIGLAHTDYLHRQLGVPEE